jgi:hypothetical protein
MMRFLFFVVLASSVAADVAVPQRVLQPRTLEEAWNVIRLVTANVDRLQREKRGLEVVGQISLISPSLRLLADQSRADGGMLLPEPQAVQAFQWVNQIARHSMVDNPGALSASFHALRMLLEDVSGGLSPEVRSAEIHQCPVHGEVIGRAGDACGSCRRPLKPRRIPYSFIYARPEKPAVKLVIPRQISARAGQDVRLEFELRTPDDRPVEESDLWLMHAQAVQVMVTDPRYEEFHHLTATQSGEGRYSVGFVPAHGGDYRIIAGVTPASTGLPEYPAALLKVEGEALPPRLPGDPEMSVEAGGWRFSLSVKGSLGAQLQAGQTQALQLHVSDLAGQPVTGLEPLHQAFAHIHGFFTDTGSVLQLHPVGGDILRDDVRGGPALAFKIFSPEAGRLRLFVQVRIEGRVIQAPLTLMVRQ